MAPKRIHDYAFNIMNDALVISPRTGRDIAMPNHRIAPPSPASFVPGAWPSTPRHSAPVSTTSENALEDARRSYLYIVGKCAIVPLALFLFVLPYRLVQAWFRPQQVIVENIEREDGARKRRIIDAGTADNPYTPTPTSRTRAQEHLARQGRGRVESLGDRLRRIECAPTTPLNPIEYVTSSPQSVANKSIKDESLSDFDITFDSADFICSTPPQPSPPTGAYDSPDGPDGGSHISPDTPDRVVDQGIEVIQADAAARDVVGSPQVVASPVKSTSGQRNMSPGARFHEICRRFVPLANTKPKQTLHRHAPLYPFGKPSPSLMKCDPNHPRRKKMAQSGPQAVKVGPPTPYLGVAAAPTTGKKLVPHLGMSLSGHTVDRFNPSVILPQYGSDLYGSSHPCPEYLARQQQSFHQSTPQQQYMPQEHYVPSASLNITETVNQDLSHLEDAPDVDYDGVFAVAEPAQTTTTTLQAPITKMPTPLPKRAVQFAPHAVVNTYFSDERMNKKMDAQVKKLVATSPRMSAADSSSTTILDVNGAAAHDMATESSSLASSAMQEETSAQGAVNKPSSTVIHGVQDKAPAQDAVNALPAYVDTLNKLSAPAATDEEPRSTEEVALDESDFSSLYDLREALPVPEVVVTPAASDEQKRLIEQYEQNELKSVGEYDSLFDSTANTVRALITPLSDAEQAALDAAAAATDHGRRSDAFVVDPKLRAKDFGTLLPKEFNGKLSAWVNDEIVNEYLRILTKAIKDRDNFPSRQRAGTGVVPRVHATASFWYETVTGDDGIGKAARWAHRAHIGGRRYLECELVLYPICTNSHWRLLAVKPKERTVEYLDSLSYSSDKLTNKMLEYLKAVLGEAWNPDEWSVVKHQRSTQQLNSSDCGVFVLLNSLALLRGVDISEVIACDGMMDARKRIAVTIMNQAPTTEFD